MTPEERYLDLLKRCLTRTAFLERYRPWVPRPRRRLRRALVRGLRRALQTRGLDLVRSVTIDLERRRAGTDHPPEAETMVGMRRLDHLQACVVDVLERKIPGDLIETGVWRGGASIFMAAILEVYGSSGRTVWAADSFQGLPPPDAERYPADAGDVHFTRERLAVSLDEVKANFARYGLLHDRVRFLQGWFRDTLPRAPIDRIAILRLDGDMYESTIDALRALYPKLQAGGYAIIDDFALPGCRLAVEDYRREHQIVEPIRDIDGNGAFWQRDHA